MSTGTTPVTSPAYLVRVAPAVLATIVQRSVERVPGVLRLARPPRRGRPWLSRHDAEAVRVAVYVVVDRAHNLHTVGGQIQAAVGEALATQVGMSVERVDVYVQDVE